MSNRNTSSASAPVDAATRERLHLTAVRRAHALRREAVNAMLDHWLARLRTLAAPAAASRARRLIFSAGSVRAAS